MAVYVGGQAKPEAVDPKDPQAVTDYDFDWTDWLGTDTIASHTVTVPSGLTKDSDSEASGVVTFFVSGGTPGKKYDVVCTVTTAGGRTDQRTMRIPVANR